MRPVADRFGRSCAASSVATTRTIPVRRRNNVGKAATSQLQRGGRRAPHKPAAPEREVILYGIMQATQ
jgi:hypothetical protein